jgi:hypothetical protein
MGLVSSRESFWQDGGWVRRESCDVCLLRGLKEFDDVVFPCLPLVRHSVFNVWIAACPAPFKIGKSCPKQTSSDFEEPTIDYSFPRDLQLFFCSDSFSIVRKSFAVSPFRFQPVARKFYWLLLLMSVTRERVQSQIMIEDAGKWPELDGLIRRQVGFIIAGQQLNN